MVYATNPNYKQLISIAAFLLAGSLLAPSGLCAPGDSPQITPPTAKISPNSATPDYTPLRDAIKNDDLSAAKAFLADHPKLFEKDAANPNGNYNAINTFTVINDTIKAKKIEFLKLFSENGADFSKRYDLLRNAIDANSPEIVDFLLQSADYKNYGFDVVNVFIKHGVDINAISSLTGKVPLATIISRPGNYGVSSSCRFLMDHMKSLTAPADNSGQSLIEIATLNSNIAVVKELHIRGVTIDNRSADGKTPLHGAVESLNLNMVEELIKNGADINAVDNDGETPLAVAFRYQLPAYYRVDERNKNSNLEIVLKLIESGASASIVDKHGVSVYMRGVLNRDTLLYRLLPSPFDRTSKLASIIVEDKVADLKAAVLKEPSLINEHLTGEGFTLLHLAAVRNSVKCLQYLIASGAGLNAADASSQTPLYWACKLNGNENAVKILLKAGANPYTASSSGDYPLSLAVSLNSLPEAQMLIAKMKDTPNSPDAWKIRHARSSLLDRVNPGSGEKIAALLFDNGFTLEKFSSLLTAAVYASNNELITVLVKHGSNLEGTATYSVGQLESAIESPTIDVSTVETLLKVGANPNVKTRDNQTILANLERGSNRFQSDRDKQIIELLKKYGAKE
jgi:ankyrin repeat protein